MGKFSSPVNRLFERSLRFVPASAYREIAESTRSKLAKEEKRPDLAQRVEELRVIFGGFLSPTIHV